MARKRGRKEARTVNSPTLSNNDRTMEDLQIDGRIKPEIYRRGGGSAVPINDPRKIDVSVTAYVVTCVKKKKKKKLWPIA